jgi:hypothetical protein
LLGHRKIESTVRYLGIEVDDALAISEQVDVCLKYPGRADLRCPSVYVRVVPCMDGARGAREKNLTFRETIRVQPCIRPLDAAVLAAGPDVIR